MRCEVINRMIYFNRGVSYFNISVPNVSFRIDTRLNKRVSTDNFLDFSIYKIVVGIQMLFHQSPNLKKFRKKLEFVYSFFYGGSKKFFINLKIIRDFHS